MGLIGKQYTSVALTAADIADDAVTSAKVADAAITSAKIADGSIVNADINASAAIAGSKLLSGIAWQAVQTTGFTAVAGKGYPCNTTAGAFTATLPASASVGDEITLVDYAGTFDTNQLGINPNGLNLKGATYNLYATSEREGITLTYIDATQGWAVTSGSNEGTPALGPDATLTFLVIAGGGSGGNRHHAGGGGGGGYRTSYGSGNISGRLSPVESTWSLGSGVVATVTVGGGGAIYSGSGNNPGNVGVASSISASGQTTITSSGGGYGSGYGANGGAGGCGGGSGSTGGTNSVGSGTLLQGFDGGLGAQGTTGGQGGGGGGAGTVGASQPTLNTSPAPAGGDGISSSITGSAVTRTGGGAGGNADVSVGPGGSGGGGGTGVAGTVNTGSGGGGDDGGGGSGAGAGGSGVVILRVSTAAYSGTSTGSPTVTTDGTDTVLTFNGSGTYTG
jgi:hypothetical protein